jgi:hypothetical protein
MRRRTSRGEHLLVGRRTSRGEHLATRRTFGFLPCLAKDGI